MRGEGIGNLPRTYPSGTKMAGQPLLTIADRLKQLGYVTGFSGKWHCGLNDDPKHQYDPRGRGFDEYWVGSMTTGSTNLDLEGNLIPTKRNQTGSRTSEPCDSAGESLPRVSSLATKTIHSSCIFRSTVRTYR